MQNRGYMIQDMYHVYVYKNGIKGIFSMHIYVIDIKSYHKQLTIDCFCQKGSYKIVVFKVIVENVVNIN